MSFAAFSAMASTEQNMLFHVELGFPVGLAVLEHWPLPEHNFMLFYMLCEHYLFGQKFCDTKTQ